MSTQKNMNTGVYNGIIYNTKKVEIIQMSINLWMDKQNVVYQYKDIIWPWKGKKYWYKCYHMDEPWKDYVEWKKTVTKDHLLYDSIYN